MGAWLFPHRLPSSSWLPRVRTGLLIAIPLLLLAGAGECGVAAPQSQTAAQEIQSAETRVGSLVGDPALPPLERHRLLLEHLCTIYSEAGYDFDATLLQNLDDGVHGNCMLQGSIFSEHFDRLAGMLYECLQQEIHCRPLFPADLTPQLDLLITFLGKQPS